MKFGPLFDQYGTDKNYLCGYGPIYDKILDGRKISTVLEFGVKSGASLLAWAEAFPKAMIYGIDISLARVTRKTWDEPRIRLIEGDATDPNLPLVYALRYDLIVDDASHRIQDQIEALKIYGQWLTPDGVYVIEDIVSDEARDRIIETAHAWGYEATGYYSNARANVSDNRIVVVEP